MVTVVAILAALAFPIVSSARDESRETNCQSNLKQIYAAYRMYAQDYNKKYPAKRKCLGSSSFRAPDDPQSLVALLRPYAKSERMWLCPSAPDEHQKLGVSYMWTIARYGTEHADVENVGTGPDKALAWDNYIYRNPTAVGARGNPNSAANRYKPFFYPHRGGQGSNWLYNDGQVKFKAKVK